MDSYHRSQEFLQAAKRRAKQRGYDPSKLELAKNSTHKLTYHSPLGVRHFGRRGYGDFLYYSKFEPDIAQKKQNTFIKSHSAISQIHNLNKYSPNELALKILW
jgi:hypothetical protein